eukprot:COSAG01_NODE_7464_length_3201_cov_5.933914_3_plen_91_part_00
MLTALRTKPGASAATHDDDDSSTGAADVLARAVARSPDMLSTSTTSAGGGSLWATARAKTVKLMKGVEEDVQEHVQAQKQLLVSFQSLQA